MVKTLLPKQGTWGSIPGQGTRCHMPQLRVQMPQRKKQNKTERKQKKILHATMKTWCSQINKTFFFKELNKEHDRKIRGTEEPRDELTDTKHTLQKTENPAGILLIKLVLG